MINIFIKKLIKFILSSLNYEISTKNNLWFKGSKIPETSYEKDNEFHGLYDLGQKTTDMVESDNALRRLRHYTLIKALNNAQTYHGDVVELGCWKGLSTFQIATYLKEIGYNSIFHVFDSFEGLSELDKIDMPDDRKVHPEILRKTFKCSLDTVKQNLNQFNFIKYYKGWIPDEFFHVKDRQFSFVHIDVDLYQPIKDTIDFFYPKLCKNGIIVFDDYGCTQFPGAKQAIDEFIITTEDVFFIPLPSGQAILIKRI